MGATHTVRNLTPVVIADRRGFDRLALEVLCQHSPGFEVAASVDDISAALSALGEIRSGTVLVGSQLLRRDGRSAIARLRSAGASRILLVSTGEADHLLTDALRVDADGVLKRDGDVESQLDALNGQSGVVPRWQDEPEGPLAAG
jgi:DNA-binding NarL/FixJ family response regulator